MQVAEKTNLNSAKTQKIDNLKSDNTLQPKEHVQDSQKEAEIAGIPPIIAGTPPRREDAKTENPQNQENKHSKLHQTLQEATDKETSSIAEKVLKQSPTEADDPENTGSSFSKFTNLSSAITNLFSAGTLIASVMKGFFENKNDFYGLKKGHEEEFSYGSKKLSDKRLPEGEKLGWLVFKVGSFLNAIGCFAKYFNTRNPAGIMGGILSLLAVPIQEKITGTLMSTIAFSLVAIGLGEEGDPDYIEKKTSRGFDNTLKGFIGALEDSSKDAIKFMKDPLSHLPHRKEAETKVLMNFIAYLNTFAATGGILGRAFGNKAMNRFFVKIDKVATAFQSLTELIQGLKEKWDSSEPGSVSRASAIFQTIGAALFTPAALIYDSKLGKAVTALASGFYGLHAALTSVTGPDYNNAKSETGKSLVKNSSVIAWGSTILGLLTGLFFTKQESKNNTINRMLKLVELNPKG